MLKYLINNEFGKHTLVLHLYALSTSGRQWCSVSYKNMSTSDCCKALMLCLSNF